MPIDTRIDGNPDTIHRVAEWLRSDLSALVVAASDALYRARTTAEAGWDGAAVGEMTKGAWNAVR